MRIEPQSGYDFVLGACDWQHDAWAPGFYPDVLPLDWRLSFYAHRFAMVLLPEARWLDADDACLDQWLEDTDETFGFVLEVSAAALVTEPALRRLRRLGKRVRLLLVQGQGVPPERLRRVLAVPGPWPMALDCAPVPGLSPATPWCWRPSTVDSVAPSVCPAAVVLVAPAPALIVAVVRQLLTWTPAVPVPVLVAGALQALEQMEAAFALLTGVGPRPPRAAHSEP